MFATRCGEWVVSGAHASARLTINRAHRGGPVAHDPRRLRFGAAYPREVLRVAFLRDDQLMAQQHE